MSLDPYAPSAYTQLEAIPHGTPPVDAQVIAMLERTRPWVRLFSVIGFICTGLTLLIAATMLFGGVPSAASSHDVNAVNAGIMTGMAAVFLFPSIRLRHYRSAIMNLSLTASPAALVHALDQQRGFWKLIGIITSVALILYLVTIAGVAIFATTWY